MERSFKIGDRVVRREGVTLSIAGEGLSIRGGSKEWGHYEIILIDEKRKLLRLRYYQLLVPFSDVEHAPE